MGSNTVPIVYGGNFNELDNFVNYKVDEIVLHSEISFTELQNLVFEKIDSISNFDNVDIYACIGSKDFIKKDIVITEDNDVKWLVHLISSGVEKYCSLIIHSRSSLSLVIGNRHPIEGSSIRHDEEGCFYQTIDLNKITPNFHIKMDDMFSSKEMLLNVVRAIAIRDNFQYKTDKSNKKVLVLSCLVDECQWSLRAHCIGDDGNSTWIITRYDNEHSCSLDIVLSGHRQATFSVIKECIKKKISIDGSQLSTPKDIVHYIRTEYGLNICYMKAWRAREAAINEIRGSPEESYQKIPSFAYMISEKNPGSIVEYKVDEQGRFLYFFMALSACISGWKYCRPVISVDGTVMKNKYGGTLLTACTPDANEQIFPLAFCVVDSENDSSWQWFMSQLSRIIGHRNDVVIVSDRHKSIVKAVELLIPNAFHCICIVHLHRNIKPRFKGKLVDNIFFLCAKAFSVVEFEVQMRQLESSARGIRDELESIGYSRWSRAYSPRSRYLIMTTNLSESLNYAILDARGLPITSMLEALRMIMQQWFHDRRNEANYQVIDFTKSIEKFLREEIEKGRTMQVNPVNNMQYQVLDGTFQHDVHLPSKSCSCRKWNILQILCSHVCAMLSKKHLSIKDYVAPYYLNTTLSSIYKVSINPLSDQRSWHVPEEVASINILPPNVKRPVGRPKKVRIPSQMEFKKRVKCSRCGRQGHNKKRCRFSLMQ